MREVRQLWFWRRQGHVTWVVAEVRWHCWDETGLTEQLQENGWKSAAVLASPLMACLSLFICCAPCRIYVTGKNLKYTKVFNQKWFISLKRTLTFLKIDALALHCFVNSVLVFTSAGPKMFQKNFYTITRLFELWLMIKLINYYNSKLF